MHFIWIIIQTGMLFPANPGDIIITEFSYNNSLASLPEYVEIFNATESPIEIHGWKVEIDDRMFEIDGACDDERVTFIEEYTDESACTDADYDWKPFSINSNDYAVILSKNGLFRGDDGTTTGTSYCSSFHYGAPLNECDMPIDNLFWSLRTFSDLSNTSGRIIILDNSSPANIIDSVAYNMDENFLMGGAVLGKAAVFIIDPKSDSAYVKNNDRLNWRSSEHASDYYLWEDSSRDFGSPLSSNFITPSISIEAYETSAIDSTKNTICTFVSDSTICYPGSDGRPGGYAVIQLTGSAVNVSGDNVTLDSLYWEVNNNISLIDSSKIDSLWHPIPLLQDTHLKSNIYNIPLVTRSTEGFWGKTDTTIYLKQEINTPPKIQKINNQPSQAIINIFDNSDDSLFAVVTDSLLCETSCTREDSNFYFPNTYFGYPNSSFGSYENYENNSPFLWSSDYDNLLSTTDSLVTYFTAPTIEPLNNISANNIQDTLTFKLQATDPFGDFDTSLVTVIVHNKNQRPTISDTATSIQANLNSLNITAGYSFKLDISGNQIELHEYDASGELTETSIIGEITDLDNDLAFTISPQGSDCEIEFADHYCVTGNTIRTEQTDTYENLTIPFIVADTVTSPIYGFDSDSLSDIALLHLDINKITKTVLFDDADENDNTIRLIDGIFHLPEDSTLSNEIGFKIEFKLDESNLHNINLDSLNWSFDKLDSEGEQRVFAHKAGNTFKIDSLSNNFNGLTGLKVSVADFDNAVSSLVDSIIINIPIFIDQRNDTLKQFNLYHDIANYNVSTIDTVREVRYFRLPQFTNENNTSNPTPAKLKFGWKKNNDLDIDTDVSLNKDAPQNIFYRLELIDTLTNVVSILQDSLPHNFNDPDSSIWAEIDLEGVEFPFYYDNVGYTSHLETQTIDINGLSTYRWRVAAKNYWQDDLGGDPMEISQDWGLTDFQIDLKQPEVSNMDIIVNDMYPGYYDLLWNSSEPFLTDSTFLSINEETNQFSAISMLNPRKITDNLFHFTGLIPMDLTSVTITFDLQSRDNAMNSGERIDEISYVKVSPDSNSTLISPSDNVSITLSKYSVLEPVQIIITEENNNILSRKNEFELIQITPTIHFYPKELTLYNPAFIVFNVSEYLSSEFEIWQLVIVQIIDNKPIQLATKFSDHFITASIIALGDYAVFLNSTLEKPLPSEFKIKMNYPNPFNPSTTIPIELPQESFVEVAIYNILGKKIVVLSEGIKSSGYHKILWNGTNQFGQPVSSGIYFVSVRFGQKIYHQKMMLLK